MDERAYLRGSAGNKSGSFSLTFIFSAILHAVFFAALIVTPGNGEMSGGSPGGPVINISMVTLEGQPAGEPDSGDQEESKPEPEKKAEAAAVPEKTEKPASDAEETAEEEIPEPEVTTPPPEPEKAVIIPEKKKPEPEVKKIELEKPRVIRKPEPEKPKPVKKPEPEKPKAEKPKPVQNVKESEKPEADKKPDQEVKEDRSHKLSAAIDRLKQKHKNGSRGNGGSSNGGGSNQNGNGAGDGNGSGQGQGRGSGSGFGGWGGRLNLAAIEFYKSNIIPDRINRNWALSEHLLERRFGLKAILVIKIMPDGRIEDAQFEQQSGDRYFDDSVLRAVMKSNPLPAPPREGYSGGYYQVGLIFTPEGLN